MTIEDRRVSIERNFGIAAILVALLFGFASVPVFRGMLFSKCPTPKCIGVLGDDGMYYVYLMIMSSVLACTWSFFGVVFAKLTSKDLFKHWKSGTPPDVTAVLDVMSGTPYVLSATSILMFYRILRDLFF